MIADTAVSSSPWSAESLCYRPNKDYESTDVWKNSTSNSGILGIDVFAEIDRIKRNTSYRIQTDCNLSTGTSIASSECSDEHSDEQDLYLDIENDIEESLFEDITSSLMGLIEENDASDSAVLDDMDIIPLIAGPITLGEDHESQDNRTEDKDNSESIESLKCNCHRTPEKSKKQKSSKYYKYHQSNCLDSQKWCNMSENDRVSLVEDLSNVISGELGLREQLEVIRIINPTAQISSTDKEFIIELDSLNDEKLQKIQEYLRLHAKNSCTPEELIEPIPVSQKKLHKKQKIQERRSQHKVHRQRRRKEYRQALKERRSGLFTKEEVMSLSTCPTIPEDEDIDILG